MQFTEDLSIFFDPKEFADVATVDGVSVNGLFVDGYAEANGIAGTNPTFLCETTNVDGVIVQVSVVVVRGKTYTVCGKRPDGIGRTILDLEYQSG